MKTGSLPSSSMLGTEKPRHTFIGGLGFPLSLGHFVVRLTLTNTISDGSQISTLFWLLVPESSRNLLPLTLEWDSLEESRVLSLARTLLPGRPLFSVSIKHKRRSKSPPGT